MALTIKNKKEGFVTEIDVKPQRVKCFKYKNCKSVGIQKQYNATLHDETHIFQKKILNRPI